MNHELIRTGTTYYDSECGPRPCYRVLSVKASADRGLIVVSEDTRGDGTLTITERPIREFAASVDRELL